MSVKWKLDRLRAKVEESGHSMHYSETKGIGTLSIHDKDDNVIEWWEGEIKSEDDLDDLIMQAEADIKESKDFLNSHN